MDRCTSTEAAVAAIWTEILGNAPESVDDDFFSLGGQSLSFVRFLARVKEIYGVELEVDSLFESGFTVAGTASQIEQCQLAALDDAGLDDLLSEFDGMSEDQLRDLLARGD